MKKQLLALGAFFALTLGALPSLAACPCQSQAYYPSQAVNSCCPAPAVSPCCSTQPINPCCCPAPVVSPCCTAPCPCPAAPIQSPCCQKRNTCNDCCD